MIRRIFRIMFFLISFPVMAQTWHDEEAKFRLEVKPGKAKVVNVVDLHAMIFPCSLKNGVTVYTSDGKKLPHRLGKETYALFIGSAPEKENIFVYFGYDNAHPFDCWNEFELGKVPEASKLQIKTSSGRTDITSEKEMLANANFRKYLEIRKQEQDAFRLEQDILADEKALASMIELKAADNPAPDSSAEALRKRINANKIALEEKRASVQNRTKTVNLPPGELKRFKDKERETERSLKQGGVLETITAKNVLIEKAISTKNRNFLGMFTGPLLISEPGIYSFAINSRDASHLVIDDKLVAAWPYRHERSETWEKTGEIFLDQGVHQLSYYFQKGKGEPPFASAAWKKPGETEYKLLDENDFSPAFRSKILSCSDKDGKRSPMVRYEINGHFFLGNDRKADWIDCEIDMAGEKFTPLWKIGNETISGRTRISIAPDRKSDMPIILSSKEKSFQDIRIEIPDDILKESDNHLIEQDIVMRLSVPQFIFDDENLEMSLEIMSAIPSETSVQLKVSPLQPNPMFKEESSWVDIEPRKNAEADPYSLLFIWKRKFDLVGEYLANGLQARFTLAVPPLNISEESLSFIPLAKCQELKYDPVGFFHDINGKRIIPVLHRPTLAEKRKWSFVHSFADELIPTSKILVIADDFGENGKAFSSCLAKALEKEDVTLEFAKWQKDRNAPAMCAGLGSMLKAIASTNADKVIIIPSVWDTDMGVPARLQLRTLSAMVQAAQSNSNVRKVALATPFPHIRDNPVGQEVSNGIRQDLRKDYALDEIIDLDDFVRSKPEWKSSYRASALSSALLAPLPVGMAEEISSYISSSD